MPGLVKLFHIDAKRDPETVLSAQTPGRKSVDLSWNNLGLSGQNIDNVFSSISDDVEELDLGCNQLNKLTGEDFEYLPPELTYLSLRANSLSLKDAVDLLEHLPKSKLKTLDLSDNPKLDNAPKELIQALNANLGALEEVILSNSTLILKGGRFEQLSKAPAPSAPEKAALETKLVG